MHQLVKLSKDSYHSQKLLPPGNFKWTTCVTTQVWTNLRVVLIGILCLFVLLLSKSMRTMLPYVSSYAGTGWRLKQNDE